MNINASIYIAGHKGLVGSALVRCLAKYGYKNLLTATHSELDLTDSIATDNFFKKNKPEYVFLSAAKVGGILANNNFPAEFITQNLEIQINTIKSAYKYKTRRLFFLGSSCIYPKETPQPIKEIQLLTGPLEETNSAYALAKIAGIELCRSYNHQYNTKYISIMPCNLYGLNDNYHPENSHVIPGLIQKFHYAKKTSLENVSIWGTGNPKREFLFSDDLAEACIFLAKLNDPTFNNLLNQNRYPLINVGYSKEISINELAHLIKDVTAYNGSINFDISKPDGTYRKLIDSTIIKSLGWSPKTELRSGLEICYSDFLIK